MQSVLDPAGHRVPRTKLTCLLHTWRPHRQRPFTLVLHLHQHESSHNLHLQYLAKNQSTQRCQSLITLGSDHPPVLEPHMVLILHVSLRDLREVCKNRYVRLCFERRFREANHPEALCFEGMERLMRRQMKDRSGDQRGGGSELEPIKILLQRENSAYTPNSQPRIPTRVCQGHVVTTDLPTLGTNPQTIPK
jgi:hypothetical protein